MSLEKAMPARLGEAIGGDARGIQSILAEDFRGASVLWPAEFDVALDDGNLTVRRGRNLGSALRPRAEFPELLRAWTAALRDVSNPRVDFAIDGCSQPSADRIETKVRLRVSGPVGEGSLQHNLRWNAVWRVPGAEASSGIPRLLSLVAESAEEVRARVQPLAELTREVLGGVPRFEDEILHGSEAYHLRQDRLSSQPMLGMHGLALGDVDGDGFEDLYLPQPGGQPNRLLLHQPDGTLREGARAAGLDILDNCGPALILDLDNDGDQDVVAASASVGLIAWNDGQGRFTEHTLLNGPDESEITTLCAADPDADGDLDVFGCRYVKGGVSNGAPVPYWFANNGAGNLYWRNEGGHRFTEAAKEVGFGDHRRYSLAALWEDLDEDGDIDLYVVNDFGRNCFYRNDGGRFTDVAEAAGAAVPAAGMGVTCGDIDHDGNLDLFLTNMDSPAGSRITTDARFMTDQPASREAYMGHARGNTLLLGKGGGAFRNATAESGAGPGGWAWGGIFFDLQNDTWPDLYVPNGFVTNRSEEDLDSFFWRRVIGRSPPAEPATDEYVNGWDILRHLALFEGKTWNGRERNFAYLNLGGARFAEASSALGIDFIDDGRVAAATDWDDDGRVDLWVRNRTSPRLRFLRNVDPDAGHWIVLELRGTSCNRDAIGAVAFVEAGGLRQRRTVYAAEGFMCGNSRRLHFGLGPADRAERIEVRWPGGVQESFADVAAGARYRIVQGTNAIEKLPPREHPSFAGMRSNPVRLEPAEIPRIVLYERLPARPLEFPGLAGSPRTVGSFQGRTVLAWIGSTEDPASLFVLRSLAARRRDLDQGGVPLIAMECAQGLDAAQVRERMRSMGVDGELCGLADRRFLQDLQVLVMEILGPFDRLAYPLTLLFDRGGQLTVLYSGVPRIDDVLTDVVLTHALDPEDLTTEPLLKGRWARPYARNIEGLGQVYDLLGRSELASFYRGLARERGPR